jgi:nicotinamidase-related amidase/alkylated DNA repair dioxygenase AlkB
MFEISEGDLPIVQTRKALLILDLQNEFVASGGVLPVDMPADYIEKIFNLVPTYRSSGCVIWVRSQFETYRPVNDGTPNGDRVITDRELSAASDGNGESGRRRGIPSKTMLRLYDKMLASREDDEAGTEEAGDDLEEPYDNETYLTPELGKKPRCVLPLSSGADYAQSISQAIDRTRDLFFTKSHYSAFKSGTLLQILRGQFVTELFICGALTNISVFATAMDAAQFGYSITLLEDCLGYRSKARHDEAIRQLIDTTGCEVMTSSEAIEAMKAKESTQSRPSNSRRPVRDTHDHRNLHSMITNLKLRNDTSATSSACKTSTGETSSSNEASTWGTKATTSHDSLQPAPLTSDDSLMDKLPLLKKADGDTRKRVPNKIKTRRRLSKSHSKEAEGQSSGLTKTSSSVTAPLSPTHITLTSAAEALKKIPTQALPDESLPGPISTEQADPIAVVKSESETQPSVAQDIKIEADEKKELKLEDIKEPVMDSINLSKDHSSAKEAPSRQAEDTFPICEGDSEIIHNLLPQSEASDIFEKVRDEVRWQKMSHQGGDVPRLVSVQGEIGEDGSIPIYRHPADESPPLLPFTPAVSLIRSEVEKRLGHKVNHCLIQFYRNGADYISEHSDKTLDIAPDSFIANVSLGALRTMTFRTKKPLKDPQAQDEEKIPRLSCKVPLPHNSMCKMSLRTNMKWLHSIRQDKRALQEKSEAELAYDMGRISLTFRLIATFLDKGQTKIWGQGAVAKEKKDARTVINGSTPQAEKMLWAFGIENHSSDFDWQEAYGQGFDVLHIQNQRKLFLSGDVVADLRVKLALSEFELDWSAGQLSPFFYWKQGEPHVEVPEIPEEFSVRFVDNDLSRARAQGDLAILLYLDASYGTGQDTKSQVQKARRYTRLQQADAVLQSWRAEPFSVKPFRRLLALWDVYASEDLFIAGPTPSVADFAFWPVLHEVVKEWDEGINCPDLQAYYDRMLQRDSVQKVIAESATKD